MTGRDQISKAEITKDALQSGAQAAAATVGEVAGIVTRAVGDVAAAVGGFATEIFEIRDSSKRALAEQASDVEEIEPDLEAIEAQSKASLNEADLNDPS